MGIEDKTQILGPPGTLSPVSFSNMNTLSSLSSPTNDVKTPNGTIRSVPSDSLHLNTISPDTSKRLQTRSDLPAMPHSTIPESRSLGAMSPLTSRQVATPLNVRNISSEFSVRSYSNNNLQSPSGEDAGSSGTPQWSATVGKTNQGRSGRVIDGLTSDNDKLRRELTLERLQKEEAKQAVQMAEGRLEQQRAEFESSLHDAQVNKTLLKRRERQFMELKAQIDAEKKRADDAVEREEGWRRAMEEIQEECKIEVEKHKTFAALMEGRNKTMENHWKTQESQLARGVERIGQEIADINLERTRDDERMNMLQSLCDQQKEQLQTLEKQKAAINDAFEAYKGEQDAGLKDIKAKLAAQELANEETVAESKKVLAELKWALNVKKNVRDAQ